jgi:hypothetical protein
MNKLFLFLLIAAAFGVAACSKQSDPVGSSSVNNSADKGATYNVVAKGSYKGHTWSDWSNQWWSWAMSMPSSANAVAGTAPMETNQTGDVWFLSGLLSSGSATRSITVPQGKAIFFPILNLYGDTTGGAPPADQLASVIQGMWDGSNPTVEFAEIDGHTITSTVSNDYFAQVTTFINHDIPSDNILGDVTYGQKKVSSFAASCGVYIMIDGLSTGSHTIHFKGTNVAIGLDMTYNVTVK